MRSICSYKTHMYIHILNAFMFVCMYCMCIYLIMCIYLTSIRFPIADIGDDGAEGTLIKLFFENVILLIQYKTIQTRKAAG